jgi:hypothetical protein
MVQTGPHWPDCSKITGIVPAEFLDELAVNPDKSYKVNIGPASLDLSLKNIVFDATKG